MAAKKGKKGKARSSHATDGAKFAADAFKVNQRAQVRSGDYANAKGTVIGVDGAHIKLSLDGGRQDPVTFDDANLTRIS